MPTVQRLDGQDTQFGSWLRNHQAFDASEYNMSAGNVDWIISRWSFFMMIEEKRRMKEMTKAQFHLYKKLNKLCLPDNDYYGFHLLQFEGTSPRDGRIYINKNEVTERQLITFLRFEYPKTWYLESAFLSYDMKNR
jgi:hypothetical protein